MPTPSSTGPSRSRVLLFTGKGGVGKTTVAAATAVSCARLDQRTVVVSTDPAHSLADVLGQPVGDEPTAAAPGLWAAQLDARKRLEDSWADIRTWLVELLGWAGIEAVQAEELAVLPGLDELFALTDIARLADDGRWDTVVVDCAPTAETLRLLSLPDVLTGWMARVLPTGRRINRVVGPVVRSLSGLPVAGDEVFSATERVHAHLLAVQALLADRDVTRVRLVVNPEALVVAEARRTATTLALFGYGVDAVVANRLLPDDLTDPWFEEWKAVHARHLRAIEEGFAPLPVLRGSLGPTELVGVEALAGLGAELYGASDPAAAHGASQPLRIEREPGGYRLLLELPFTEPEDLDLGRRPGELVLRVGPHRRSVLLPDSLVRRQISGASLRDGVLVVRFADPAP